MKKLNNQGFTLIEVLAVIVIIAVLGLISVPSVLNTINTGKDTSYQIMVKDIKIASQQLFDELEYANSNLYHYDTNGNTSTKIQIETTSDGSEDGIIKKKITTTLQSLVSNGTLTGTNNEDSSSGNKNTKIILNPKNSNDIGICSITITKTTDKNDHYKTSYQITNNSTSNVDCPTTDEYNQA